MYRFTKKRRLSSEKEYQPVFSKARRLITNELILLFRKNELTYARIGLAISKKVVAKANQRNRIKRIIRESFRTQVLPAVDIVVLAKKGSSAVDNKTIHSNLSIVWEKLIAYYAK